MICVLEIERCLYSLLELSTAMCYCSIQAKTCKLACTSIPSGLTRTSDTKCDLALLLAVCNTHTHTLASHTRFTNPNNTTHTHTTPSDTHTQVVRLQTVWSRCFSTRAHTKSPLAR